MTPTAVKPASTLGASSSPTRTPHGILKRPRPKDEDLLQSTAPKSPSKRPKVEFDTDDEIFDLSEANEKSSILVQEEVRFALRHHAEGQDDKKYKEIKALFSTKVCDPLVQDPPSSSLLAKHLAGLTNNVLALNRSCADLVNSVINMHWLGRDEAFVARYVHFLGTLVSAQGGYAAKILNMLVFNFAEVRSFEGRLPGYDFLPRARLHDRLHATLKYLLQLVPTASSALSRMIPETFPYLSDARKRSKRFHVEYIHNILRMTEYAPELKSEALDLIMERLVKIDVQAQIDSEDIDEDIEDYLSPNDPDACDSESDLDSDDSDNEGDSDSDNEEEREKVLKNSLHKLDSGMDIMFDHYASAFAKPESPSSARTFTQLLAQFRKTVLPTYRSRHTQFLLFRFAQASPTLTTSFIDALLALLKDKSRAPLLRISSAAYLASFVARARHISPESTLFAFDAVAAYAADLRAQFEPSARQPDLRKFAPYYAAFQSLMYIFCFRWRDLLTDPDPAESAADSDADILDGTRDLAWASGVKEAFAAHVGARLNPLKVCAPEIVDEFARMAHGLNFMYVFHIVEANKRVRLSQTSGGFATSGGSVGSAGFVKGTVDKNVARESSLTGLLGSGAGERMQQLDAYFPFDPYGLPRSRRWVEGWYNEWRGLPGDGVEAGGDEDAGSDEEMLEGTETPED